MAYAIYILAASVIGLLIGFVALSVIWLKNSVVKNIRSKTLGLMSVYDEILDDKSSEIKEKIKEAEALDQKKSEKEPVEIFAEEEREESFPPANEMMKMAENAGSANYRSKDTGSLYKKIRKNFSFDLDEVVDQLSGSEKDQGEAEKLLNELNFDTVYNLSTLTKESQMDILNEVLPDDGKQLLEEFLGYTKDFNVLKFYDFLKSKAEDEPKAPKVHVSETVLGDEIIYNGVRVIPDEDICEGFFIEENNRLYDYCIKSRELS